MSIPNVKYNVNVQSKFALFLNDDLCEVEPDELVKKLEIEKKQKKEAALKEAKKLKNQKVVKQDPEPTKIEEKKTVEKAPRFQKMENKVNKIQGDKFQKDASEEINDRNHSRNRKNSSSGPRKFRGREFDRHSGSDKTGVKPVDKREGSGAHNWGNVKDDIEVAKEELNKEENTVETSEEQSAPKDETEKKEPEKSTLTLAEWRALNKENSVISAANRQRPANNGQDVFSGMNPYKKQNKNSNESDNEIVLPDDDFDCKGRREIKVNVEFTGRNNRGRGGRRQEGGFNNSRFNKDDKKKEKDVLINLDENEFPTLS